MFGSFYYLRQKIDFAFSLLRIIPTSPAFRRRPYLRAFSPRLRTDRTALYSYSHSSRSSAAAPPEMPSHSVSSLKYISNADLSKMLLDAPITKDGSVAVIDVRDSDYVGGHVLGCTHVPSGNLDWKLPELVRTLKDKETVVFHCALSQQRGPSAALRYLRERDKALAKDTTEKKAEDEQKEDRKQNVYVLEGGFVKWQEKFGDDERLTEGYQKDIWQDNWY